MKVINCHNINIINDFKNKKSTMIGIIVVDVEVQNKYLRNLVHILVKHYHTNHNY